MPQSLVERNVITASSPSGSVCAIFDDRATAAQ